MGYVRRWNGTGRIVVDNNEDVRTAFMMLEVLKQLRQAKGEDRSEKARRYAVTITEMEKVFAYFNTFVAHVDTDKVSYG